MRNFLILIGGVLFMSCQNQEAPKAEKIAHQLEKHGDIRQDPYYWMNKRDDPKVLAHLKAENDFALNYLSDVNGLQKTLFEEMKARIQKADETVPVKYKDYFYSKQFKEESEHAIHIRRKDNLNNQAEVILDLNERSKGKDFYDSSSPEISPNQKLLAFAEDFVGRRIYTLRIKDLETGEILDHEIPNVTRSFEWGNDSETLFFIEKNPQTLRSEKVYRYDLKTKSKHLVHHEKDETFYTYITKSPDDRFIFIVGSQTVTSEVRLIDADKPKEEFKVFTPRERGHEYHVFFGGDRFYILSNRKAQNFKLLETPLNKTEENHWKEVLAHNPEMLLEDLVVTKENLALQVQYQGLTTIQLMDRKIATLSPMKFPESAYSASLHSLPTLDTTKIRYGYESMKTPDSVFEYDLKTQKQETLKTKTVLGGFKAEDYITERSSLPAHDGKEIPVSLVRHKDTQPSENTPLLLYAYGSYGYSLPPYFSSHRLSFLNRGFIYAIAHIRGGQTLGRDWYDQGRLLNKKNTFFDFNSVAEGLIKKKYTSAKHLYAQGGSAGGLLMGAIINMRPELYNGVIAEVPFVDVLTTMLDSSIPLTTNEYDEWGNPNDKAYYDYIKSYSPYDNIKEMEYPNLFVTTGYHDSQVQYWEPAKWVARLRELKKGDNTLIFHTDMESGHSGASGRFKHIEDVARTMSFFFKLEGIVR